MRPLYLIDMGNGPWDNVDLIFIRVRFGILGSLFGLLGIIKWVLLRLLRDRLLS